MRGNWNVPFPLRRGLTDKFIPFLASPWHLNMGAITQRKLHLLGIQGGGRFMAKRLAQTGLNRKEREQKSHTRWADGKLIRVLIFFFKWSGGKLSCLFCQLLYENDKSISVFVCTQKAEEMRRNFKPSDKRQNQTGDAFLSLLKTKGICYQIILKVQWRSQRTLRWFFHVWPSERCDSGSHGYIVGWM